MGQEKQTAMDSSSVQERAAYLTSVMFERATAPAIPLPYAPKRTDVWSGRWFIERKNALFGASLWFVWRTQASIGTQIAVEYFSRDA